jgi:hypothetical protein
MDRMKLSDGMELMKRKFNDFSIIFFSKGDTVFFLNYEYSIPHENGYVQQETGCRYIFATKLNSSGLLFCA